MFNVGEIVLCIETYGGNRAVVRGKEYRILGSHMDNGLEYVQVEPFDSEEEIDPKSDWYASRFIPAPIITSPITQPFFSQLHDQLSKVSPVEHL